MVYRILLFSLAASIFAETRAEETDQCESKAEGSVSLDLAIQLLQKVKEYHNQDRPQQYLSKNVYTRPMDCEEVLRNGANKSGIYSIWQRIRTPSSPIKVFCDMDTDGGGWTVFQRRGDFGSPKNFFFKYLSNYKKGFGGVDRDFWLGNDNIFALTNQRDCSLRVDLRDVEGKTAYAVYDTFWIDDADRYYTLHIGGYSGDAGDSMIVLSNGQTFSNDDSYRGPKSCVELRKGAWWHKDCGTANLNGLYHKGKHETYGDGVNWNSFRGDYESLEWTEMKIRSREFSN